jgi:hypothetical protein
MSIWRCGWIYPRSYFFAAVFFASASFAVLLAGAFLGGRLSVGVVAAEAPPAPDGPGCRSHPVPQQRQDQPWVCSPTSRDG